MVPVPARAVSEALLPVVSLEWRTRTRVVVQSARNNKNGSVGWNIIFSNLVGLSVRVMVVTYRWVGGSHGRTRRNLLALVHCDTYTASV